MDFFGWCFFLWVGVGSELNLGRWWFLLLVLLFGRYITISKDTYASFFSEWDSCFTLQLLQMNGFFFACLFVCFFLGKFYSFWLCCFSWHQDLFSSFLYQLEMIGTVDAVWMLQGADPNTLGVAAFKEVFTYTWTRVFQTCGISKDVCFTYIYPLKYLVIAGNSPQMDYLAWWIVASRNHSSEGPLPTCFTCVGKGSRTNRAAWNTAVFLSCENKIK